MKAFRARFVVVAAAAAWLVAATVGFYVIAAHAATPGAPVASSADDGDFAAKVRTSGRATLVMVAHPRCPCTRASLHELERVLAKTPPHAVDVVVLFAGSRDAGQHDRVSDDLRSIASAIPNVRIVDDFGGVEAARLGARTSGTVLFYDHSGTRRFAGGITASRGHEGDSDGADALRALLRKEASRAGATTVSTATASSAPAYGCSLSSSTPPSTK